MKTAARHRIVILSAIVGAGAFLGSCLGLFGARSTGSIVISVESPPSVAPSRGASSKTLRPDGSVLQIDDYRYSLSGPNGEALSQTLSTDSATFAYLAVGDWTVTVTASNDASAVILSGSAPFTVKAGDNVGVSVALSALSGIGTVKLTINLPSAVTALDGTIQRDQTGSAVEAIAPAKLALDSSVATYTDSLEAGSYRLILKLRNAGGVVVGRIIESLDIFYGLETARTVTVTEAMIDDDPVPPASRTINHATIAIDVIPVSAIDAAKASLSVYYGHTSHGSQLISGMSTLDAFKGGTGLYAFNATGDSGALRIVEDTPDAGYYPEWYDKTIAYLGAVNGSGRGSAHPEVNVVMWSWCGQLSDMPTETLESNYLTPMAELETTYTGISFVYFTGHLDGSSLTGALQRNNETIRTWCDSGNRWLYDFADIESYDPDGTYFGDKRPTDGCNYDYNLSGGTTQDKSDPALPIDGDRNWAMDWQDASPGRWYVCLPAHTQDANGNMKAYAAWWLFARIAGWAGQ